MLARYLKFLINGGLLGLAGWGVQRVLFHLLGKQNSGSYALASLLTYTPFILINFSIQRRLIFGVPGVFSRFIVANIIVMFAVSALAPVCREVLAWNGGAALGDQGGFMLAALIGATPSFLLSNYFVFKLSDA